MAPIVSINRVTNTALPDGPFIIGRSIDIESSVEQEQQH